MATSRWKVQWGTSTVVMELSGSKGGSHSSGVLKFWPVQGLCFHSIFGSHPRVPFQFGDVHHGGIFLCQSRLGYSWNPSEMAQHHFDQPSWTVQWRSWGGLCDEDSWCALACQACPSPWHQRFPGMDRSHCQMRGREISDRRWWRWRRFFCRSSTTVADQKARMPAGRTNGWRRLRHCCKYATPPILSHAYQASGRFGGSHAGPTWADSCAKVCLPGPRKGRGSAGATSLLSVRAPLLVRLLFPLVLLFSSIRVGLYCGWRRCSKVPAHASFVEGQLDTLLYDALAVPLLCSVPSCCRFRFTPFFALVSMMAFCCFLWYLLGFSAICNICHPFHKTSLNSTMLLRLHIRCALCQLSPSFFTRQSVACR